MILSILPGLYKFLLLTLPCLRIFTAIKDALTIKKIYSLFMLMCTGNL